MNQDENLLNELKQVVLNNLENEQFSVERLAQKIGVSRSHLHRKLKKLKGQSISQFVREIRLAEALKLLRKDVATTSEIAYKVGFNSPSYFHKCFQEYYGYPPSEVKDRFKDLSESKESVKQAAVLETPASSLPDDSKKEKSPSLIGSRWLTITILLLLLSYLGFHFFKTEVFSSPLEK